MHSRNFVVKKCAAAKFQTQTFNMKCCLDADINESSRCENGEQHTLISALKDAIRTLIVFRLSGCLWQR